MRRTTVAAVLTATALTLGGCTLSADREEAAPSPGPGATTTDASSPEPSQEQTPEGPSPEELSAQVLEVASAPVGAPIASQTVTVADVSSPTPDPDVTIDVLALRRTDDATLLTIQMSTTQDGVQFSPGAFNDLYAGNAEFFTRFALEDPGNGIRYRPLSWLRPDESNLAPADGPANSCVCPYRGNNAKLSPEPLVFDAMFGPLPEGVTTVTLTAPGGVSLPDLPVQPADG